MQSYRLSLKTAQRIFKKKKENRIFMRLKRHSAANSLCEHELGFQSISSV